VSISKQAYDIPWRGWSNCDIVFNQLMVVEG
jgi:hypothetical protein